MADVEAATPDWAKATVAASSNACFLSSLLGRATTFYLTRNQTPILRTKNFDTILKFI
jgi:hypothetical protein